MQLDNSWFTEKCEKTGMAFSLRIKEKLHSEQTEFQKIEIFETETFGTLMVIDGLVMLSDRDNFIYHEMMSHVPLMCHSAPRDIVIIGGGDCGTLKETLKHSSIQSAIQVDIDERVTRLAEKYFPRLCSANTDARAKLVFDDGIKWVAQAEDHSADVIIVDSTDPVGPAVGLFQTGFYTECYRVLRKDGLIIQQSGSPLVHIDQIKNICKVASDVGFKTTQPIGFPVCVYPSGWWSATIAYKQPPSAYIRAGTQAMDFDLDTKYYNKEIHRSSFAMPRFFQEAMDNI